MPRRAAGADPGWYVIDIDGVLIEADSDKQHAAPTYKHGFGFYPLLAFLDATGETGDLVPSDLTNAFVADRISQTDCRRHGFILDGYPRSLEQAQALSCALAGPARPASTLC